MRRTWLCALLLCGLAACQGPGAVTNDVSQPPPTVGGVVVSTGEGACATPAFTMVDGGGSANYSAWGPETGSSPRALLTKEPEYRSAPIYFNLELGNAKSRFITLALDESGGPGKGYDTLYVDANNHGDLTDFPPIKLDVQKQGPQQQTLTPPAPIPLTIRYHDGESRQVATKITFNVYRYGASQTNWSVMCQPTQHVEGKVSFGGKETLVGIYDANSLSATANWCFDDYGADRLRIDLKGDGKLDAAADMPLSKVIAYDGKLWELDVNSAATRVSVKPCGLPSGPLALAIGFAKDAKAADGRIEMANHGGIAFSARLTGGAPTLVPVGKYRITSASLTLDDGAGTKWDAAFSYPRAIEVLPETGATLALGPPIKLETVVASAGPVMRGGKRRRRVQARRRDASLLHAHGAAGGAL